MNLAASLASFWRRISMPSAFDRRLRRIENLAQTASRMDFDIGDLLDRDKRWQNIADFRRLAKSAAVGDSTVLCRTLGKYKQYVSGLDVGYSPHVILDGFWEYHVTEFIARNVSAGATVLDLGANFGYFTLLMADLVGDDGVVYAFEPNPVAVQALRRTLIVNNFYFRVRLDTRAIWDSSGQTVTFHVPEIAPINARIVEPLDGRLAPTDPGLLSVDTVALDDLPITGATFIKADIEGAEERLWRGSRQFLARNPDVILLLEVNCTRCTDPRAMLEDIAEVFTLRHLDGDSYVKDITIEQMLASQYDWMLVLSHREAID
jgi:FkbM family methyltransferase